MNLIEEKVGSTLERIGTGDHFLNITPAALTLRETINFLKLKSFCKAKNMVNKKKQQPNLTSDRGLISKIYKELKKLVIK